MQSTLIDGSTKIVIQIDQDYMTKNQMIKPFFENLQLRVQSQMDQYISLMKQDEEIEETLISIPDPVSIYHQNPRRDNFSFLTELENQERPRFFEEWQDIEGYYESLIENNKELNANLAIESMKEELIRDFNQQFNACMQPRAAVLISESVYNQDHNDLPSPKHQNKDTSALIFPNEISNNDGIMSDRSHVNNGS